MVAAEDAAGGLAFAVVEHVVEDGAVVIVARELFDLVEILIFVCYRHVPKAVQIVVRVKLGEIYLANKVLVNRD